MKRLGSEARSRITTQLFEVAEEEIEGHVYVLKASGIVQPTATQVDTFVWYATFVQRHA